MSNVCSARNPSKANSLKRGRGNNNAMGNLLSERNLSKEKYIKRI